MFFFNYLNYLHNLGNSFPLMSTIIINNALMLPLGRILRIPSSSFYWGLRSAREHFPVTAYCFLKVNNAPSR